MFLFLSLIVSFTFLSVFQELKSILNNPKLFREQEKRREVIKKVKRKTKKERTNHNTEREESKNTKTTYTTKTTQTTTIQHNPHRIPN